MPGQEVPALMLTLIPKLTLIGVRWERHIRRIWIKRKRIAMNRRQITPARRISESAILQSGDRLTVPIQDRRPDCPASKRFCVCEW